MRVTLPISRKMTRLLAANCLVLRQFAVAERDRGNRRGYDGNALNFAATASKPQAFSFKPRRFIGAQASLGSNERLSN